MSAQAGRLSALPGAFRQPVVPLIHLVQPLLEEDVQRGPQAVEQLDGRGVRPVGAVAEELEVVAPVKEHACALGGLGRLEGFRAARGFAGFSVGLRV
jgi:hypothetical protein